MPPRSIPGLFPEPERSPAPTLRLEEKYAAMGHLPVAGLDEAGRGPLAGPVVAAAVVLPQSLEPDDPLWRARDSKVLAEAEREALYHIIAERALDVSWAACMPAEIDETDILAASLAAMERAAAGLECVPALCLVDGNQPLRSRRASVPVVKGDAKSLSIAAASIVAKVIRDRIMVECHRLYPAYGFAGHKGYPTRAHKEAISKHGPCPIHRLSFKGVREFTN